MDETATKANLTQAQRDALPAEDFAGPDRTYPITDQADVDAAAHLIGKADDPEQVKARILAICRRKGLTPPEAWAGKAAGMVVTLGPAVKAMGDGRVGGYLVQFGSEATKDAEGEWFTADTDFDTDFPARASVYYHHGQDPSVGRQRLTHGKMERDEHGVHIEAQLDVKKRDQAAIYRAAERGELGWSSGSLAHVTIPPRERPGGAIKQWPLGHDASLTRIPSDRRNAVVALKSVPLPPVDELIPAAGGDVKPRSLAEVTECWLDAGETLLGDYRTHAMKAGRKLSAARRERLTQMHQLLGEMLAETDPDPTAASRDGEQPTEEAGASSDAGDLEAQFMAINARLNGCPIPLGAPYANPGGTT